MLIRSAFWIGRPKAAAADRFRVLLEDAVVPAMRSLPGVSDVQVLWPDEREDDPPDIACQVLVMFEGPHQLDQMMNSEERKALRPNVLALRELFDGKMSHINYRTYSTDSPGCS